jgi:hypothetical protein
MTTNPRNTLASLLIAFALSLVLLASANTAYAAEDLRISSNGSTAGYLTLDWSENSAPAPYTLQMNKGTGWQTIYQGNDTATTLTGLQNGDYQFRINSSDPATIDDDHWSDPISVTINHHSLVKALSFFASGLIIFIILLWLLFFAGSSLNNRPPPKGSGH